MQPKSYQVYQHNTPVWRMGYLCRYAHSLSYACHQLSHVVSGSPCVCTHRLSCVVCRIYFLLFIGPLPTHFIGQCPSWEAHRFSASQEIPPISWKPKVHYRIRKYPSPVRILSQLDPVHTLASHFLKITAAPGRSILLPQFVSLGNI